MCLRLFICTVLFVLVAGAADEIRAEASAEIRAEIWAEIRADIRELRADITDFNKKLDTERDEIQAEVSTGIKELQTKRKREDSAFTFLVIFISLSAISILLALRWWSNKMDRKFAEIDRKHAERDRKYAEIDRKYV